MSVREQMHDKLLSLYEDHLRAAEAKDFKLMDKIEIEQDKLKKILGICTTCEN